MAFTPSYGDSTPLALRAAQDAVAPPAQAEEEDEASDSTASTPPRRYRRLPRLGGRAGRRLCGAQGDSSEADCAPAAAATPPGLGTPGADSIPHPVPPDPPEMPPPITTTSYLPAMSLRPVFAPASIPPFHGGSKSSERLWRADSTAPSRPPRPRPWAGTRGTSTNGSWPEWGVTLSHASPVLSRSPGPA